MLAIFVWQMHLGTYIYVLQVYTWVYSELKNFKLSIFYALIAYLVVITHARPDW